MIDWLIITCPFGSTIGGFWWFITLPDPRHLILEFDLDGVGSCEPSIWPGGVQTGQLWVSLISFCDLWYSFCWCCWCCSIIDYIINNIFSNISIFKKKLRVK